jgi:hypothetical protein
MFARTDIRIPLRFQDPSSGKEGKAEAIDISASGAGFITNAALSDDTPIEMWLDIPDQHEPLHLEGKVVWSKALNSVNQHVGVRLQKQEFIGLARALRCKYNL